MATRYPSHLDRHPVNAANEGYLSSPSVDRRRPSSFKPPDVLETIHSKALEIIPKPPKAGSSPIFRITGIPLSVTQEELMDILMDEFDTENGILPNASRLGSCSSCYGDRTQTALLEFTPRAPSILLDYLKDKSNKGYMISHPSGEDITIDQDFYGLTQLYPTSGPIKADIVAVCGLDGHAYGSWSGKEDNRGIKRMWLRDFLRDDLPSCRTMIYGYDSRLKGAYGLREVPNYTDMFLEELKKARRTREEKNRPIVFIGHSFGGILIAEAVVKAKVNVDKYESLFENTKATIFYATPHRELVVDDIISMTGDDSAREDLVKSLRHRSEGDLHKFKDCTSPYGLKIISYKEIEPTQKLIKDENGEWARKGGFFNEVAEESAVLHLPASIEDRLAVDGDHSTLVKFQYKAQLSYTSVLRQVEGCTNDTGVSRYVTAESAIKNGTYHDLARVLESGTMDVNVPLKHLQNSPTLLHIATSTNDVRKVDLLLEKGANIEARDCDGSTALHEAIASKNIKIVELLLQSGAPNPSQEYCPNHDPRYHLPLLHFACAEGNCEIVEIFLKSGDASLEVCAGYQSYHPVHFAAMNKDASVLEMLIVKKKVSTEVEDREGRTPLHLATASGLERNIRSLLLHGANIEATDQSDSSPLQVAIESGNEVVMDVLLDNHADITDGRGYDKNTALHLACMGLNEKLVKRLLDRKAEIEVRNSSGMTPLLYAAKRGSKSIIELLVRNKADVTAVDYNGRTLLHMAAENMNEDLVELILSYGADIEALDHNNYTPLLAVAQYRNGPAAGSLLRNGASTDRKDFEGNTTPLHYAITGGSYEIVKHLLDHKANVQARDEMQETPLHIAVSYGNEKIVKLLLEHKADKKARNLHLAQPIDAARKLRNIACIKLLEEGS